MVVRPLGLPVVGPVVVRPPGLLVVGPPGWLVVGPDPARAPWAPLAFPPPEDPEPFVAGRLEELAAGLLEEEVEEEEEEVEECF